jgi:LPS-assembly lipoprotein
LIAALALVLTACGFHLRGNIPLPDGIKNMFVEAPQGSFKDTLEDVITNAGGNIQSARSGGDVVLVVQQAKSDRTIGTLDERGKVNSYNLILTVKYVLNDRQGKQLRTATLQESRRYNFNPEQVIESESEEADLLANMEQDIALRVVRQLSTVTDLDYQDGDN